MYITFNIAYEQNKPLWAILLDLCRITESLLTQTASAIVNILQLSNRIRHQLLHMLGCLKLGGVAIKRSALRKFIDAACQIKVWNVAERNSCSREAETLCIPQMFQALKLVQPIWLFSRKPLALYAYTQTFYILINMKRNADSPAKGFRTQLNGRINAFLNTNRKRGSLISAHPMSRVAVLQVMPRLLCVWFHCQFAIATMIISIGWQSAFSKASPGTQLIVFGLKRCSWHKIC